MGNRRVSSRRVKRLRTYNVAEAALATGATTQTVRKWLREGLEAVPGIRPTIVTGADLIGFIKEREAARKRPCGRGRLYCLRCKEPREPAFGEVEYWPDTATTGALKGLCSTCGGWMVRRTTLGRAQAAPSDFKVSFRCGESSLGETSTHRSNHHIAEC
jgi:hypothetical protein